MATNGGTYGRFYPSIAESVNLFLIVVIKYESELVPLFFIGHDRKK